MKGRIYSEQKCPICGGKLNHNERRGGLFCQRHPEQAATKKFIVRFGRDITKRFQSYREAERCLIGLRFKTDEGTFDSRDYKKDNPLGFETLATKWLSFKEAVTKKKSYANLNRYMTYAIETWGQSNIKTIGYAEIEDFLFQRKDISDKTRSNMRSCLHDFWVWLRKRKIINLQQFPEFPEISFELGFRNLVDKETQEKIIDEIYRRTFHINPKIWLGIKWLATYISIRPGELLNMKEGEIDTKLGYFIIPHPKEKKPKLVPILPEDLALIEEMPRGLPHLDFFRHVEGISGVKAGQKFGEKYLYKKWKEACAALGVYGVDLYGGTRHSTTTALRSELSPEEIKAGTLHTTNKAFERYMQGTAADALTVYQKANSLTKRVKTEGKLIKLNK